MGETREPPMTPAEMVAVPAATRYSFPSARDRQRPLHERWAQRALVGAGAVAAGATMLTLAASAMMAHRITRPRHLRVVARQEIDDSVESVTFRTDDGLTLHGWYLAPEEPRDAVVICHGFAMSRHELLDLARALRARGHAVLLFDFRAHGASEGVRSTIGLNEAGDIGAAVAFLRARPELAGRRIGVAGISMGAAAALMAAARNPEIAAVAADSSFASLHDITAGGLRQIYHLPSFFAPLIVWFGELLTRTRIGLNRPIEAVAAIAPRPLLLIHGERDTLVPTENAHALHDAAGGPKELWIVPDLGHASAFLLARDEYIARLDRFFARALQPGGRGRQRPARGEAALAAGAG